MKCSSRMLSSNFKFMHFFAKLNRGPGTGALGVAQNGGFSRSGATQSGTKDLNV